MKIGVYGMGRFGTLWASLMTQHATQPTVLVGSRSAVRAPQHCQTASLAELATVDILFLTVSISALQEVLHALAPLLSPHTIVCDTCSVKSYPCKLLKTIIPRTNHVIGTHPLFGPDSNNWHSPNAPDVPDVLNTSSESNTSYAPHQSAYSDAQNNVDNISQNDENSSAQHSSKHSASPDINSTAQHPSMTVHNTDTSPTDIHHTSVRPSPADGTHRSNEPAAISDISDISSQPTYTQQVALVPLRPSSRSYSNAVKKCTDLLSGIGCQVISMSAAEHDKQVAQIQGLTHLIGRTLAMLKLKPHQLRTLGYTKLLEVMQQTCNDSMELFIDLQRYNPYTRSMVRQVVRSLRTLQHKIDNTGSPRQRTTER